MISLQHSLGIDFRDDALRLVLLGKTFRGITLVDHFYKGYPGLSDKTGEGEVLDELVADLKAFLERHDHPDEVILGIPRQKVILKEVKLPALGQAELKEVISYEVDKHIPLPTQDVYYDYQVIERVSEAEQKVMLGIIRKEDMDFYLLLLERANLVPSLATPSCYALNDCPGCNHFPDQKAGVVIDLGEKEVEIDLLQEERLLLSRMLPIRENKLDDAFIGCQTEKAEEEGEVAEGDAHARAIGSGALCIVREWLRAKRLSIPDGLSRILLTGVNPYTTFLSEYLHSEAGVEVLIPNTLRGLTEQKISGQKTSALTFATGLALKGLREKFADLNLLPVELRVRRISHALPFTILFSGILILIIAASAYTGFGISNPLYIPKKVRLKKVMETSTQMQDQIKEIKLVTKKIEEVSKEVDEFHTLMSSRVNKLDILKELSEIIPKDVWLEKADIDSEKLELSGYADTASSLIGILEDSHRFENVIFPSTITRRGGEKEKFYVKANIQKGLKGE